MSREYLYPPPSSILSPRQPPPFEHRSLHSSSFRFRCSAAQQSCCCCCSRFVAFSSRPTPRPLQPTNDGPERRLYIPGRLNPVNADGSFPGDKSVEKENGNMMIYEQGYTILDCNPEQGYNILGKNRLPLSYSYCGIRTGYQIFP